MLLPDEPLTTVINHTTRTSAPDAGLDWGTIVSIVGVLVALFVALRTVSQTKQIEIRSRRFERLCIQPVEASFAALDGLFVEYSGQFASTSLRQLSDQVAEVNLTLARVRELYPRLDIDALIRIGDRFSDKVYQAPRFLLSEYAADYARYKQALLNGLYKGMEAEFTWWRAL